MRVGDVIDRYTIQGSLGKGGQGEVFLALHPTLHIEVAIKFLREEYRNEESLLRIQLEAKTLASLNAENIVRIFAFEPGHEPPYIAMEYCSRGDLNQRIHSRRQVSLAETIGIVRQLCLGLGRVHGRSIIHRDLKPANILFNQDDIPKVTDFGLAKEMSDSTTGLTRTGMGGTLWYSSPEQITGLPRPLDHRTDLWSMGVILHEMLTWMRPFGKPDDTPYSIGTAICHEEPIPPPYEIPEPIQQVISKALEKDRENRFGSASEMIAGLDQALAQIPNAAELLLPPDEMVDDACRLAREVDECLARGESQAAREKLDRLRSLIRDNPTLLPGAMGADPLYSFWKSRLGREAKDSSSATPGPARSPGYTPGRTPARSPGVTPARTPVRTQDDDRLAELLALVRSGSAEQAIGDVAQIIAGDPGNAVAQQWMDAVREEKEIVEGRLQWARQEAESACSAGEFQKAADTWAKMAGIFPDHPEVLDQRSAADYSLALHVTEERALELMGAGDPQGAIGVWDNFLTDFPSDTEARAKRKAVWDLIQEREQAQRRATLRADASRLEKEGDLGGALACWEELFRETPSDNDAVENIRRLQRETQAHERLRRLEAARSEAQQRRGQGDLVGAVAPFKQLERDYPGDAEILAALQELEAEREAQRQQAASEAVQALMDRAQSLLTGRRYASLPDAEEGLKRALSRARSAKSAESMDSACQVLDQVLDAAAETVTAEVIARRSRLLHDVQETAAAVLAGNADVLSPAAAHLQQTLQGTLHSLATVSRDTYTGDLIESLDGSRAKLEDARGALAQGQERELGQAREVGRAAMAGAREAVELLARQLGPDAAIPDVDLPALQQRLTHLEEQIQSILLPSQLTGLAMEAELLHAEVTRSRLELENRVATELRPLLDEARSCVMGYEDEALEKLLDTAAHELAGESVESEGSLGRRITLGTQLRAAIDAARGRTGQESESAARRWAGAESAWGRLDQEEMDEHLSEEATAILRRGEEALSTSRPEELAVCAAALESLCRRAQMERSWGLLREDAERVEGPSGPEGLPRNVPPAEEARLLGQLRRALTSGDQGALDALKPALRSCGDGIERESAEDPARTPWVVPVLSKRARALNQRLNPEALREFEEMAGRLGRRGRRPEKAAQLGIEAERAYRRLVQPQKPWGLLATGGAIALAGIVMAWAVIPGTSERSHYDVKVLAPLAAGEIQELIKDSAPIPVPGGRNWSLAEGQYEIIMKDNGKSVTFRVPEERSVLLPGGAPRLMPYVNDVLELNTLEKELG